MMTVRRVLLATLLLVCGFVAGVVLVGRMRAEEQAIAQPAPVQRTTTTAAAAQAAPPASTQAAIPDFSRVAQRTIPSVVNVSSQQLVRRPISPLEAFLDPDGQFSGRAAVANSLGSGVIVSPDGYILTNNHVVTGDGRASLRDVVDITVVLSDKREMPAKVIAVDQGTDLALLKVEPRGQKLPAMPWGDSDRLKVAEWVLAIGNPYQLSETVTLGIVSALNRRDANINQFGNFIQTDAAINPGNSGGALINASGELVGINTAIFSQSGGYQGIGFAVASNLARQVMSDLQTYGEVRRGTINAMSLTPLTTLRAQRLGAPENTRGVIVADVLRGSPADRAGFAQYDIVVSYNGMDVVDSDELIRLVGETKIGSTATIAVLRRGKRIELKVPIEQGRSQQR
jgi:serine protease Do